MREILFRGKRVRNGKWVYGSPCKFTVNTYETKNEIALVTDISVEELDSFQSIADCEVVFKDSVGQYTGLKDKNGVKIFEGDEIRISYIGNSKVGYVKYVEGSCYISPDYYEGGEYHECMCDCRSFGLEIVGNIHDK